MSLADVAKAWNAKKRQTTRRTGSSTGTGTGGSAGLSGKRGGDPQSRRAYAEMMQDIVDTFDRRKR